MGFNAISQPSAGVPTAAGLTALVAKARDEGASAGDVYQDSSTGLCYRYSTVGSGILLPPEWYDRVGPLKTQDSSKTDNGPCYLSLADTEADLTARGWAFVGSPAAKTADNPLVIDGIGGAQYMITSSSGTAIYDLPTTEGLYVIARIENTATHSGLTGDEGRHIELSNGTKTQNFSMGVNGVQGRLDFASTSSTPMAAQYREVWAAIPTLGSSDGWAQFYFPDSNGVAFMERLDTTGQGWWMAYSDLVASAANRLLLFASSTLSACTFKYYEFFAFEVT